MPETKAKEVAEDAPVRVADFTAQEQRVAEAYIELVRKQTKLTYRYLRDIVAERESNDGS